MSAGKKSVSGANPDEHASVASRRHKDAGRNDDHSLMTANDRQLFVFTRKPLSNLIQVQIVVIGIKTKPQIMLRTIDINHFNEHAGFIRRFTCA